MFYIIHYQYSYRLENNCIVLSPMQKKLKILVDHQIFTIQTFGGISRVFTQLYKGFKINSDIQPSLPILLSDNEYIGEIMKVKSLFPNNNSFLKKLFYYIVNRIYSTLVLITGDYDIFQPTYYDPYFLPFLRGKPFVLLIHDMTHEIFPETVSKKDKTIQWKKMLVHKANRIVTISENSKKDIIKLYKIDPSKIDIVSWSTTLRVPDKKLNIYLPKKYILFVGNRNTYKNFELFFKAIAPILREKKDLYLVCAGSSNLSPKEMTFINKENLTDKVIHIKFKRDDELAYFYNNAICFAFPSFYEGFGVPILEAFACNCPVISSNTSSLPEVGGDAVEYFDPKDIKSINDTVRRVVEDEKLRKEMIKKGKERLKMFSWGKTTNSFLNIYEKILK